MAYSGTKIETWNRSTPRDGLLLDSEFSQLYDDIENYISGNSGAEPPMQAFLPHNRGML